MVKLKNSNVFITTIGTIAFAQALKNEILISAPNRRTAFRGIAGLAPIFKS